MTAVPHRTYNVLGLLVKFRAFPFETQGKFCAVECLVPPGHGAPPNAHGGETEYFVVTEGEFAFLLNGETRRLRAGDTALVPDGAVHAFTCTGERDGRVVIVNAPGRMHESFFTTLGTPLPEETETAPGLSGPPDVARVMAVAESVGMRFPAPAAA